MVKDHSGGEETYCHLYLGYSFQLATRVLLYAPSHGQVSTFHGLTSRGAMAGRRNILMGPPSYYKQILYHGISDAMTMSAMIPRKF